MLELEELSVGTMKRSARTRLALKNIRKATAAQRGRMRGGAGRGGAFMAVAGRRTSAGVGSLDKQSLAEDVAEELPRSS